jgi:hypothetical protein
LFPKVNESIKIIGREHTVKNFGAKEGHSILIKGEIEQKEMTVINLYAPNVNAPNFIKHT